jgi:hypothetical protein
LQCGGDDDDGGGGGSGGGGGGSSANAGAAGSKAEAAERRGGLPALAPAARVERAARRWSMRAPIVRPDASVVRADGAIDGSAGRAARRSADLHLRAGKQVHGREQRCATGLTCVGHYTSSRSDRPLCEGLRQQRRLSELSLLRSAWRQPMGMWCLLAAASRPKAAQSARRRPATSRSHAAASKTDRCESAGLVKSSAIRR